MKKRTTALDLWPEEPIFAPKEEQGPDAESLVAIEEVEDDESPYAVIEEIPQNKKNLNPTCVTPLIESLARPYFSKLVVAGRRLDHTIDGVVEKELVKSPKYKDHLNKLLSTLHSPPPPIRFAKENLKSGRDLKNLWRYYNSVFLNEEEFTIGDIIVIPAGSNETSPAPLFPRYVGTESHPSLGEFFWFAQILSIRSDDNTAHVRWFQHGCQTFLRELAHPQELFLTSLCDDIPLVSILAKWPCQRLPPGKRPTNLKHGDLFYSLEYDLDTATFRDITFADGLSGNFPSSTFCPLCRNREETQDSILCRRLDDDGKFAGLHFRGEEIHCADSVLFCISRDQPSGIGQVISITEDLSMRDEVGFFLRVRLYGRRVDVLRRDHRMTADIIDDRNLFLTDERLQIESSQLVGKCSVIHRKCTRNLQAWLTYSPKHFFVSDKASHIATTSHETLTSLSAREFQFCLRCRNIEIQNANILRKWEEEATPLRVFDPFAGAGAFPLGMAQTGNIKLTHAVEISSSAAQTLKKNSPSTIVYNQCSNKVLKYAVKSTEGIHTALCSLEGEDEELPPPPNKDEIDCVVSGFPCQPHSKLNMFPKVRDLENELFLNAISWVDFLQPKYCVFENVEGFTSYNLKAVQKDRHNVQGGIEKGGIKLLVRALITLGYQVRFGLLQAAHYGTPQSRVRFFLWAAQTGLKLPNFPEPTHHFPKTATLKISFANGQSSTQSFLKRCAPLPYVTIRDAISDLKRWDWSEPKGKRKRNDARDDRANQGIIQITGHEGDSSCGIAGKDIGYEHHPRSPFAARCRQIPTEDIQHITPILKDDVIRRVRAIHLDPGADYRSLVDNPSLWDYQFDPRSANARRGYKGGNYGRLDPDRYFHTIVTNVQPTAIQSWVLNPWCKRIFSVRELARAQGFPDSFHFIALDERVRTMHKHIGNAVPWPLGEALGRELKLAQFETWKEATVSDVMDID